VCAVVEVPPLLDFAQVPKRGSGFLKTAEDWLGNLIEMRYFMGFCKID